MDCGFTLHHKIICGPMDHNITFKISQIDVILCWYNSIRFHYEQSLIINILMTISYDITDNHSHVLQCHILQWCYQCQIHQHFINYPTISMLTEREMIAWSYLLNSMSLTFSVNSDKISDKHLMWWGIVLVKMASQWYIYAYPYWLVSNYIPFKQLFS